MTAAARRNSGHLEGLGCLIGVVAFFALLASVFGYYATLSEVQSAFDSEASSITLAGLPGTTVKFSLTGTSLGAFWASTTGLRLPASGSQLRVQRDVRRHPGAAGWLGRQHNGMRGGCLLLRY